LAAATMTAFLYRLRLRALARHYQAVQDERLRLARDLHDGLAQGFSAIGLHVDSVLLNDPQLSPQSQQTLARTRKLIDHVQQEVRGALSSLRVRPGRVALVEALRAVCLESAKLAGIDASVEAKGEAPFGSGRVEHELSMLCREAITNAARHGKAGRVRALIEMSRGTFTLTLVDDGAGWDSRARGEHATGWGLVGMRERVAKLGGTIAFATAEAGGLCIIVQIPAHKLSAAGGA